MSDLILAFTKTLDTEQYIEAFVESHGLGTARDIYWPVTVLMGVLLFDSRGAAYAPAIVVTLDATAKPGMALTWSLEHTFSPNDHFGFTDAQSGAASHEDPRSGRSRCNCPQARRPNGARLDPSHVGWRGFFFRDMPMRLVGNLVDCSEGSDDPLVNLVCAVNRFLVMDYGWLDDSLWTWKAKLRKYPPMGSEGINFARQPGPIISSYYSSTFRPKVPTERRWRPTAS